MVLSVPLGQMREIILDGIERLDLVRLHQLDDVRLWTALLADLLTLGADDDRVQRLLRQHLPDGLVVRRQGYTLYLPAQFVEAEEVIVFQELLYCERSLL